MEIIMFANGQKENYSRIITMTAVTVSALLQAYVMHVFMNPSNLLSGGFTGIAILIDKIASLYGRQISTSLGMLLLNIPVAFMCMKSISPRFTFYSMLQVFFASFFLKIFHFTVLFEDIMLNVIFGGFLYGLSYLSPIKLDALYGNMYLLGTVLFWGYLVFYLDGHMQDILYYSNLYLRKQYLHFITGMKE